MRVYRSTAIALSMALSHQNIKGGARSQVHRFSSPFLPPVSSILFFFFSLIYPSSSLVGPLSRTRFFTPQKKKGFVIDWSRLVILPIDFQPSLRGCFEGSFFQRRASTFDAKFGTRLSISPLIWDFDGVWRLMGWVLEFLEGDSLLVERDQNGIGINCGSHLVRSTVRMRIYIFVGIIEEDSKIIRNCKFNIVSSLIISHRSYAFD